MENNFWPTGKGTHNTNKIDGILKRCGILGFFGMKNHSMSSSAMIRT